MDGNAGAVLDEENITYGKYLTFAAGDEEYGIEIGHVTEIIGIQAITAVPELPGHMKGLINLRGKIIPIIDVRARFNKDPKEYDDRTCVIVVDLAGTVVGMIVDTVLEVLDIAGDDIVAPPEFRSGQNKYVRGIGKTAAGVKLLIDCARLFSDTEL